MLNRSFEEMGIPPGYGFRQLLFSPVTSVLVVRAQSSGINWRPERLIFATLSWTNTTPLDSPLTSYRKTSPLCILQNRCSPTTAWNIASLWMPPEKSAIAEIGTR